MAPATESIRTRRVDFNRDRSCGGDRFRVTDGRSRRKRGRRAFPILVAAIALCSLACIKTAGERRSSIYDLRDDPTEKHVQAIRDYLTDSDRDVRATALNVLVGLEVPDSVELSQNALEDPDGFVRATAAKLLGDTKDPLHVALLAERLSEDSDPIVRQRAAEALAAVGGSAAGQALVRGVEDPVDRVRLASVEGLTDLGPAVAITGLIRLLREDTVWEVRAQAARALGSTGSPEAAAALEAALADPNEFVRSAAENGLRLLEMLETTEAGN